MKEGNESLKERIFKRFESMFRCRNTGGLISKDWKFKDVGIKEHNRMCCEAVIDYTDFKIMKKEFEKK